MATFLFHAPFPHAGNASKMHATLASGRTADDARAAADALTGHGEALIRDNWAAVKVSDTDLPEPLHPAVRFLGRAMLPTDQLPGT